MKLMVMPSSIDEIKNTLNYCDAYLIGINGFSVSMNLCVDINDIKLLKDIIGNKELFISMNKNMTNYDIDKVKDIMIKLNDYNIKGLFYYDVGIVNIYSSIESNYDLVWASNHATTNYNTINYWSKFGIKYALISSDITVNEVIDIRNNTDISMIVPIFGYQSMFNSKRHIIKNYLDFFNLDDNSNINYMEKEGNIYPIIDNELGTSVYTNYILNGIMEYNNYKSKSIDYVLLNSFNIETGKFIDVLKIINNITDDNIDGSCKYINSLFSNLSTGFMYKETIARVKKNEK